MHPHAIAIWKKAGLALLLALGLGLIVSAAARQVVTVGPVTIGDHVAGSFADATGHSAQSHLVYAVNSRTWWLFTLTSTGDAQGGSNHVVKAFRSSGPDLATATWIAAADSPPALAASTNGLLGGGRSLGIAYVNNSPADVIHADISMAFDGQDGRTGHVRAIVTGTSITWASWNYFDEPAATWTLPRGNTVGVSSGKFIHTGGPILQQEVDANVRKSVNADVGGAWVSGFSVPAVIDGSMTNEANTLSFAPLANDVMLAVYDNGQGTEPRLTNLRYKRSNAGGAWSGIVVGSQTGGDGNVFSTNAAIDQNDWSLVSVSASTIYAFRRKANGTGVDAAAYSVATNTWSPMAAAPPLFAAGQSFKAGAGLFGATDGSSVWVCVVNTDLANSILCSTFDRTAWTSWFVVPGTDIGSQTRNYISGSPRVGNNQVGLIWTEGTSLFDIVATSFAVSRDTTPPSASVTAPLEGATVSGPITIAASASDDVGVAGVQFQIDGASFGLEVTSPPYAVVWDTTTAVNGAHVLAAVARDGSGNRTTAAVTVAVANTQTPVITWPPPQRIVAGTALGPAQLNATANTSGTFVYSPPSGTILPGAPGQRLSVAFTPLDTSTFTSATAEVTIDVVNVVPNVVGLTRSAAAASLAAAGLTLGTETQASSATVPAGSVLNQTPSAGIEVAANSAVGLVVSSGPEIATPPAAGAIGISFAGSGPTLMGAAERAGVVAKPNWNNASGAVSSGALPLVDESGSATAATVNWSAAGVWMLPIADGADNRRLMKGYLDTTSTSVTTVTVAGLASRLYDVYVYADGDNKPYDRSAAYTISGAGITTTTVNLTDPANTNFDTTFTRADGSVGNYVRFTITATGFTLTATPAAATTATRRAPVNGVQIVPAAAPPVAPSTIGIKFMGTSTVLMDAAERAGVVPAANWNNAAGAVSTLPLALIDDAGAQTTASVTWTANNGWMTPIADQPGNARLMKGYLDTSSSSVTTVTVAGLAPGAYDVYVYVDGDNRAYTRTAAYRIAATGITPVTINLADQADTNFAGGFSEATATSAAGNYLKFSITGDGFTLTATPASSTNATLRAPVNAIQIVRSAK